MKLIKNLIKIRIILFALLLAFGLCFNQVHANDEYEYTNLNIRGNIKIDGTIDVTEKFTANFKVQKHGIIRDIPLNYSVDGNAFHIDISNINVLGNEFTKTNTNGVISIKIGDTNKTITGIQKYYISYKTYGLIRNFSGMGYAELYRNIVPNQLDTNLKKVKAELILPKTYTGFTSGDFLIAADGKSDKLEDFEGILDWSQGNKIILTYNKPIPAGNGITISIKFPNNYFNFDHKRQASLRGDATEPFIGKVKSFFVSIFGIILGLILLLCSSVPIIIPVLIGLPIRFVCKMFKTICHKIHKSGEIESVKEKKIQDYPIIIQYAPPKGINPAEAGLLNHQISLPKHFTCLIYKRAAEKLISIKVKNSKQKTVILTKIKDIDGNHPKYEQDFFKNIFKDNPREITYRTELAKDFNLTDLDIYGVEQGWFSGTVKRDKGNTNKGIFIPIITFIICCIICCISIITENYEICWFIPLTMIIALFMTIYYQTAPSQKSITKLMPITKEGAKLISEVLGYKKFIKTCDEKQLITFLKEDHLYFDKVLPYAVAFGLETQFIKKISPLLQEMNIYKGDINDTLTITTTIEKSSYYKQKEKSSSHNGKLHLLGRNRYSSSSSYSSDSGFSSGSSFSSSSHNGSSGGGGGGGGARSW